MDCTFLATLVGEHQLGNAEAKAIARDLAYGLVKQAYRL
jgi:glucuronate isomerase